MPFKQRSLESAKVKGNELQKSDLLSLVSTHRKSLYSRDHQFSQEGS